MAKKKNSKLTVETLTHEEATRKNIPTAEYQSVMQKDEQAPRKVSYPRGNTALENEKETRNPDLDPQLVWRGKDQQDWSDLVVHAPPLYIQEKVHPKVLIDDLRRRTEEEKKTGAGQLDLFADFNGLPDEGAKTEFYRHDQNWSNRMILGDSLQVMASLAEREGLRGKVQCIYFDPPYGIKFNSNFQWSTTSRDVKDGDTDHITREPEQVKAFRDTWRDGIHSYLTYLRDRLTVARELLTDSGSIFVQIGDENVHRVRALMDEVIPIEAVTNRIFFIRGMKVMLDRDLAALYQVETRTLKQAVRRNITRFPSDFMFEMTTEELEYWRSQIVISNSDKMGLRRPPMAFCEQGVAMLSSVLRSERAIQVNIQIMRAFTQLRMMLATHTDLKQKIEELERKYDGQFQIVFEALQQLLDEDEAPQRRIGF